MKFRGDFLCYPFTLFGGKKVACAASRAKNLFFPIHRLRLMKSLRSLFLILFAAFMATVAHAQKGRAVNVTVPEELEATLFSPNTLTPCVACIGVAPTGEVYAGVDQIGSLGKGGGRGKRDEQQHLFTGVETLKGIGVIR